MWLPGANAAQRGVAANIAKSERRERVSFVFIMDQTLSQNGTSVERVRGIMRGPGLRWLRRTNCPCSFAQHKLQGAENCAKCILGLRLSGLTSSRTFRCWLNVPFFVWLSSKNPVQKANGCDPNNGGTIAGDDVTWVMHSQVNARKSDHCDEQYSNRPNA